MKPRYFKHKNGFSDDTKWIKCINNSVSIVVAEEEGGGIAHRKTRSYPLCDCIQMVKDGTWVEIKIPIYKLIINLIVRIVRGI